MIKAVSGSFVLLGWLSHNHEIMIMFGLVFLLGVMIEK